MARDIFRQVYACPNRNELEGVGGDTQEGDDVCMRQVFPRYDYSVEGLEIPLTPKNKETDRKRTSLTFCGPPLGYIRTR